MAVNLKDIILFDGEQIETQIEGNAYTDSPNPLVKLVAWIFNIFYVIFGIKRKTYIVLTNRRIIVVEKQSVLWGVVPGQKSVITLNKSSIQTVGYEQAVRWFVIKTIYFLISNLTYNTKLTYKGNLSDVAQFSEKVSALVSAK